MQFRSHFTNREQGVEKENSTTRLCLSLSTRQTMPDSCWPVLMDPIKQWRPVQVNDNAKPSFPAFNYLMCNSIDETCMASLM